MPGHQTGPSEGAKQGCAAEGPERRESNKGGGDSGRDPPGSPLGTAQAYRLDRPWMAGCISGAGASAIRPDQAAMDPCLADGRNDQGANLPRHSCSWGRGRERQQSRSAKAQSAPLSRGCNSGDQTALEPPSLRNRSTIPRGTLKANSRMALTRLMTALMMLFMRLVYHANGGGSPDLSESRSGTSKSQSGRRE